MRRQYHAGLVVRLSDKITKMRPKNEAKILIGYILMIAIIAQTLFTKFPRDLEALGA